MEENRGSQLMFDRKTVFLLLQILSPAPALSHSGNGNNVKGEKHAVILEYTNHSDQYIPHALLHRGKCHSAWN